MFVRNSNGKLRFKLIREEVIKFKWVLLIIVSLCMIGVLVVTWHSYNCFGNSMEPTIKSGDLVVYFKSNYKSGDIIVFEKNNSIFAKRIIGVPGDIVAFDGKDFLVNNEKLESFDIPEEYLLVYDVDSFEVKLDKDEYFVLGDNRKESIDSRYSSFGNVLKSQILGKVIWIG